MITFWKKLSHHKNHIDFFISKWLLGSGSHQGHGSSKPAKALGSRGESVVLSWKVSNLTKNLALQKKKRKLHHERLDCALDLRTWQTWDVSCYEVRDPRHEQKRKRSGIDRDSRSLVSVALRPWLLPIDIGWRRWSVVGSYVFLHRDVISWFHVCLTAFTCNIL